MTATDNTTMTAVVSSGIATTAVVFFREAVTNMIPWILVAVPLILLDLKFGVAAAKYRGEAIRFSKGFRRTFGKAIEYCAWVCFAATASLAFEARWVELVVLGAVIINEIASIVGNYFESKGMKVNWSNFIKAVLSIGGQKTGLDTSGIDPGSFVDPIEEKKKKKKTTKKK